jgi:hypothetical protein
MTGEQPELWGTQKRDRLATLLQQIVEMDDRLQSGELTPGQEVRFRASLLKAVHQMTEETGQLPTRTAIELPDGPLTKYELVGVDMGRASPEPGTHIERRSTEANAPQATPAPEPAPAAPAPAPATSEATQPVPPVSEQVQRTATALATKVRTSGAQPCAQLFAGRNLATVEEFLNYAIAMQWVTIDGDRIAPGAVNPAPMEALPSDVSSAPGRGWVSW